MTLKTNSLHNKFNLIERKVTMNWSLQTSFDSKPTFFWSWWFQEENSVCVVNIATRWHGGVRVMWVLLCQQPSKLWRHFAEASYSYQNSDPVMSHQISFVIVVIEKILENFSSQILSIIIEEDTITGSQSHVSHQTTTKTNALKIASPLLWRQLESVYDVSFASKSDDRDTFRSGWVIMASARRLRS